MENAEEILQCLDEFSKLKPKDIPRELEEYLCFVAKTGDPVYQWPLIKCLFREKLISVITEFYEACPSVEIPPCPNVDSFNYDAMKSFILEKLDTFAAAPFTVQRICELLTSPRKEYNRIDKYMRALEKNILVVSTREPGNRKSTENGESVVNGLESEHVSQEIINSDINVEVEMDETAAWPKNTETPMSVAYAVTDTSIVMETQPSPAAAAAAVVATDSVQDTYVSDSSKPTSTDPPPSVVAPPTTEAETIATCSSSIETVITSRPIGYIGYTPNISELIIEPAANPTVPETEATSEPATATDTSSEPAQPVEESQTAAATAAETSGMFAMTTEPILPTEEQPTPSKDEPTAFLAASEQPEQPVFVKADCSDTSYASVIQLEPEPSAVQVDQPPEKPSVTDEPMAREPEPSDAVIEAQPSETSEVHTAPQPDTVDSSAEIIEPQPSSASVQDEPEPSSSAASTSAPAAAVEQSPTPSSEEQSNETVISSTDEQSAAPGSSDSTPVVSESNEAPSAESCTSDNQVSESNQADYVVSQTSDTSVVEATPAQQTDPGAETSSAVTQTVAESTGDERMEVDEPSLPVEVTESSTNQQTDTTTTVTEPAAAGNN